MFTKSRFQTALLAIALLAVINNVGAAAPVKRIVNGQ